MSDATIKPMTPFGNKVIIAGYAKSFFKKFSSTPGNASLIDAKSGKITKEASAIKIQGHGLIA